MNTRDILTSVQARLQDNLTTAVNSVRVFSGELPDALLAGWTIKDTTGFSVLVGLRSMQPVRRDAKDYIAIEVSDVYIAALRVHTGQSAYEKELLALFDLVDDIRTAMNDAASNPWWIGAGFQVMSEQELTNVSDPGLNFSAFEILYQFSTCR